MPYAQASYPGGGYMTEISGRDTSGVSGGSPYGDMGWLMDLARRRAQQQLAMGNLQYDTQAFNLKQAKEAANNARIPKQEAPGDRAVREAQQMAAIAQARAQFGTPGFGGQPLRTVSGPGVVPGMTPDSIRMTGAQRQVFAPQSAQGGSLGFESTPTGIFAGQRAAAAGQQAADMAGIQQMTNWAAGGMPGHGMPFVSQGPKVPQSGSVLDYLGFQRNQPTGTMRRG